MNQLLVFIFVFSINPHQIQAQQWNSLKAPTTQEQSPCDKNIEMNLTWNETPTFSCKVMNCIEMNGPIEWYIEDQLISGGTELKDEYYVTSFYTVEDLRAGKSSNYTCKTQGPGDPLQKSLMLDIPAPSFIHYYIAIAIMVPIIFVLFGYLMYLCHRERQASFRLMFSPHARGLFHNRNNEEPTHIVFNPKNQNLYMPFPHSNS